MFMRDRKTSPRSRNKFIMILAIPEYKAVFEYNKINERHERFILDRDVILTHFRPFVGRAAFLYPNTFLVSES